MSVWKRVAMLLAVGEHCKKLLKVHGDAPDLDSLQNLNPTGHVYSGLGSIEPKWPWLQTRELEPVSYTHLRAHETEADL
eukprot:550119-Amphidinium_carterae.1